MSRLTSKIQSIINTLTIRNQHLSPQAQYRANLLAIIIYTTLIAAAILSMYIIFSDISGKLQGLMIIGSIVAFNIWGLHAIKRGKVQHVSRVIIAVIWFAAAYAAYHSGGIYSSITLLMVVLLVMATLLLDIRARMVVYLSTILYFFILLAVELSGNLPYAPLKDLPYRILMLTLIFSILFLTINYHLVAFRISEQRMSKLRLERERLQVQQQLTQDLAHDLRTPLSTLQTSAYLIRRRQEKGLPLDDELEKLESQAKRLNSMIEDLFQMTLLEVTDPHRTLIMIDILQLLESSISDATVYAQTRNIDLSLCGIGGGFVLGDEAQLKRAFDNLVENAIHYGQDKGCVQVSLVIEDANLIISVKDDGIGIAPDHHEQVFERFFRVDSARTSRQKQGSGVGLNAVQRIVQLHGGNIHIHSNLGEGSTFIVTLPQFDATGFIRANALTASEENHHDEIAIRKEAVFVPEL